MVTITEPRGRFDQCIQHRLQIESGPADDLKHVGRGGLLQERFTQLIEQSRVLDRDDSLGSEILHDLDLLVSEWAYLKTVNPDRADQSIVLEHWHGDKGARTREVHEICAHRIGQVSRLRAYVGNLNCLLCCGHTSQRTNRICSDPGFTAARLGEWRGYTIQGDSAPTICLGQPKN